MDFLDRVAYYDLYSDEGTPLGAITGEVATYLADAREWLLRYN